MIPINSMILRNGPAIVSISDHMIIVGELCQFSARIRNPYHGWEITGIRKALQERLEKNANIQVAKPVETSPAPFECPLSPIHEKD
jgi:hypothetical protein